MKKTIMERGIVSKFVRMISYGDNVVRLNTVWAIKNLVFEAESEVKENVMRQFGYNNLVLLLNDSEPAVQEQALNLVRNLAHKREHDIEQVFRGLGNGQLLSIIEEKLSWDDPRLLEHVSITLAEQIASLALLHIASSFTDMFYYIFMLTTIGFVCVGKHCDWK